MARPKGTQEVRFSLEQLVQKATAGATQKEIAASLGVSLSTFERRLRIKKYRMAFDKAQADMKIGLRALQIQSAKKGNAMMLKWLGENYLGQAHSHRIVDEDGKDVPIHDVSALELFTARIASITERKPESGGSEGV